MPAPARTGRDEIVVTACALLDEGGPDAVTMQAVADRVGVRSPSLYKHVRNRQDLLSAVVGATVDEVTTRLSEVRVEADAERTIVAQVGAMRLFAHARPHAYALAMGAAPGAPRPTPEAMTATLRFLLAATAELAGEAHALDAARLVVAWANGFITMELADALRMGGDIDEAWAWGLARIVAAIAR